jgi:mitochondrial fission process protein 1
MTDHMQLGLGVVPFLPFIFDKPVEHAVEWVFHKGFETFGGADAVNSHRPTLGAPVSNTKVPEKEL